MIRPDEGKIRGDIHFQCRLILQLILKYKSIIKINLNLIMSTQEIIAWIKKFKSLIKKKRNKHDKTVSIIE